jgi:hypothetical protein
VVASEVLSVGVEVPRVAFRAVVDAVIVDLSFLLDDSLEQALLDFKVFEGKLSYRIV